MPACASGWSGSGPQVRIIDEEADSATTYRFADNFMNRLMFAILEEYRGDFEKAKAIFLRLVALNNLRADGLLDDWTQPSTEQPEGVSIHPAAIEAAATAPLNSQGDFDAEPFLERAAAIAAEKYTEGTEG